jgi:hypothetical protein
VRFAVVVAALTAACASADPPRPREPLAVRSTPPPAPEIRDVRVYVSRGVEYHGFSPRSCDERPDLPKFVPPHPYLTIHVHTWSSPPDAHVILRMRVANRYQFDREGIARCDQFSFIENALWVNREAQPGIFEAEWSSKEWPCHVELEVELRSRRGNERLVSYPRKRFSIGGDGCG